MAYYLSASSGAYEELGFDLPAGALAEIKFANPDEAGWRGRDPHRDKLAMGFRVLPETVPSAITIRKDIYSLPDVLAHFVVSSRFKDLVEFFEPKIHQFIPVHVYLPSKIEPVYSYYWFNICKQLDSVDRTHTTYRWETDWTGDDGFWSDDGVDDAKIVFSADRIGSHHIWTDPHLLTFNSGLCSTVFGDAAKTAEISGLAVTPREEI